LTQAEATIKHAIRNAMTATSEITGLRAGPACDRLVEALFVSLLDPLVSRALGDLVRAKMEA
jgi:hypothetical protein